MKKRKRRLETISSSRIIQKDHTLKSNSRLLSRAWGCIVYPDSVSNEWLEKLRHLHLIGLVSPLHDRDVDEDGKIKKAHFHVLIIFEGKKSKEQMIDIFGQFGGVGCEAIHNAKAYARYLCHLDNLEKAMYNTEDVIELGGISYMDMIRSQESRYQQLASIIQFCKNEKNISYTDLIDYCLDNKFEWFKVLVDGGGYVVKDYLKLKKWSKNYNSREDNSGAKLISFGDIGK